MENNKKNIKVSVIVVTYNQEKTIARTLDSILLQKVKIPYEIIIGDDASTDSTAAICREYEKRYPEIIKVRVNEENKGVLRNYYDCVFSAEGEYISDIAGDDFWINEEKLQRQTDILDSDITISLVHTDWKYYNEETGNLTSPWGNKGYPYKECMELENLPEFLLQHNNPVPVHLSTSMYRKSFFMEVYQELPEFFDGDKIPFEDLQLIILLATKGGFIYTDIPTLAYSQHEKSITGVNDYTKLFDFYYWSMEVTHGLELRLEIPHERLIDMYKRFSHYIAMQAFHGEDRVRLEKIKTGLKKWDIEPLQTTKIILFLSKNKLIWKISHCMLKFFRKILKK